MEKYNHGCSVLADTASALGSCLTSQRKELQPMLNPMQVPGFHTSQPLHMLTCAWENLHSFFYLNDPDFCLKLGLSISPKAHFHAWSN